MSPAVRSSRSVVTASLAGVFISLMPYLLVVSAIPEIAEDLGTDEGSLGWLLTVPLLTGAALLTSFGRLGDLFGHRRVFLGGLTVSGVFAICAALAWNPASLIVFRTISQVAGTGTGPVAIALAISAVDERERPRVLGKWAFVMGVAPAIGLLAGGPAVDVFSWRGLFVIQALLVAALLPVCALILRETPRRPEVVFDVPGSLAFILLGASIMFAVDRAGAWRWNHPAVLVAFFVLFPVGLMLFRAVERHAEDPIFPLWLIRHPGYLWSCTCEFLIQVSTNGALFVAPLIYHDHFGTSATRTALYLVPMPLGMALSSPFGGRLAQQNGDRWAAAGGTLMLALAHIVFLLGDEGRSMAVVLVAWFVIGVANGLIRPALASAAAGALQPANYGAGMATTRMISTAGAAVGITLATGMLSIGSYDTALIALSVAAVLAVVSTAGMRPARPAVESGRLEGAVTSPVDADRPVTP